MTFLKNISTQEKDEDLVTRYKSTGDMETLSGLYQRYMELVYGVCLKYMKDPEEAKDCVIDIFEELVGKLKKYPVGHFKAWLYQLAKNHCLMKLRRTKNLPRQINSDLVHLEENVHLDDVLEKESNFGIMEHCLGKLVKEQRQAIELFYLKEKCYREIAAITALETSTIRSFIQNGRRNLKICMDKQIAEKA